MSRLLDYGLGSLSNIIMKMPPFHALRGHGNRAVQEGQRRQGAAILVVLGAERTAGRGDRACSRAHLQVPASCHRPTLHQIMHGNCTWPSRFGHYAYNTMDVIGLRGSISHCDKTAVLEEERTAAEMIHASVKALTIEEHDWSGYSSVILVLVLRCPKGCCYCCSSYCL
jgi:hypothetical protein